MKSRLAGSKIKQIIQKSTFFILSGLIVGSVFSPLIPATVAAAPTKQECYSRFNNQTVVYARLSIADQTLYNECRGATFCEATANVEPEGVKLSCQNPAAIPEEVENKAKEAEVKPLVALACGEGPTGAGDAALNAFAACAQRARDAYNSCNMTGGTAVNNMQATAEKTAECIKEKLGAGSPSIGDLTTAVNAGRTGSKAIYDAEIKKQADAEKKAACESDGGVFEEGECTSGEETSCAIDGVGWILCPLFTFLGWLSQGLWSLFSAFLTVDPRLLDDPMTKEAWGQMRNLANVAFVIAFLFIIYSQMTGVGLNNYGIKKLLPKLIIAAILVNASLFICQIAVDISNILGHSIKDMFEGINKSAVMAVTKVEDPNNFLILISGTVTAAIAISGVVIFAVLGILFPMLLMIIITLLVIVGILIARQALIVLLVIIAPLAFVAYLLPNTEQWFQKWRKAFVGVLVVFPIISLVFGASALASSVFGNIGAGEASLAGAGLGDNVSGIITQIIAVGIAIIPMILVPGILKKSLSAIDNFGGNFGAKMSGLGSGITGGLKKNARGELKDSWNQSSFAKGRAARKHAHDMTNSRNYADAVAGKGEGTMGRLRNRAARGVTGRRWSDRGMAEQKHIESSALSSVVAAENKEYDEAVSAAATGHYSDGVSTGELATVAATGQYASGRVASEHERAAAIDGVMKAGSFDQRRDALEGLAADTRVSKSMKKRAADGAFAKGDNAFYGNGFAEAIVGNRDDNGNLLPGRIGGKQDLARVAVQNAAGGNVTAEHIAGSSSGSDWLAAETASSVSRGEADGIRARTALIPTFDTALTSESTKSKITDKHKAARARL